MAKKFISLLIAFALMLTAEAFEPPAVQAAFLDGIDIPSYYKDPQFIKDADFFGVWNEAAEAWDNQGVLNYSSTHLKEVERCVQMGDYAQAKQYLREYVSQLHSDRAKTYPKGESAYMQYMVYKHNIMIGGATALALLSVGDDWGWIERDITDIAKSTRDLIAFNFIALEKDTSVIEIKGRQGEQLAPRLEIVVNGVLETFPAVMDAVVSAGSNLSKSSAALLAEAPDILKVAESASSIGRGSNPVDENTFRTYLKFDLSGIKPGDTVSKATLRLYARNAGAAGGKEMFMFRCAETLWDDTVSWTSTVIKHYVLSYDGDEAPSYHISTPNADYTLNRNPSDFGGFAQVAAYARDNGEPDAVYQYMRCMMYFINKYRELVPAENSQADLWGRSSSFSQGMRYWIDSEVVTDDVFMAVLKYMWNLINFTVAEMESFEELEWSNNLAMYDVQMFMTGVLGFKEVFADGEFWEELGLNALTVLSDKITFPDGSTTDAGLTYPKDTLNQFMNILSNLYLDAGRNPSTVQYPPELGDNLRTICRYLMDMTYDLRDPQYGDTTSFALMRYPLDTTMRLFPDPNFLWVKSYGTQGTKPEYTSVIYPFGGRAVMRSDWSNKGLYLFTNNDRFRYIHGHDDDLAIVLAAYGQYLLVDPLYYTYSDHPIRNWLMSKQGHNAIMINGNRGRASQVSSTTWGFGYDDVGPMNYWETNSGFDFIDMTLDKYENVYHTRDIMFIKNKFWIVTDLLAPEDKTVSNRYEQLWHFLPDAELKMGVDSMVLESTAFAANLKIFPVGTEDYAPVTDYNAENSGLKTGYYSEARGSVVEADYGTYLKKDITGDTTFNTILFPMTASENYEVTTRAAHTGLSQGQAAALIIDYTKKNIGTTSTGTYFNLLDKSLDTAHTVEDLTTDGQLFYAETTDGEWSSLNFARGSFLTDNLENVQLVKSNSYIEGLSVQWQSRNIYLDAASEPDWNNLTVFAGNKNISRVYWKDSGNSIPFKQQGRYVYFGAAPIIPDDTAIDDNNKLPAETKPPNTHGSSGGSAAAPPAVSTPEPPQPPIISTEDEIPEAYENELIGHWGAQELTEMIRSGILLGDGSTLGLDRQVTRAEFITLLVRALELDIIPYTGDFADVSSGSWYADYVQTSVEGEFADGVGNGLFEPNASLTREQMAKILVDICEKRGIQAIGEWDLFADGGDISGWAREYVYKARALELVKGNGNNEFLARSGARRDEAAAVIFRLLRILAKS